MTTISIISEPQTSSPQHYRAVAGGHQAVGDSAGQALDALTAQLGEPQSTTLVVVQHLRPDEFFSAAQQQRLGQLMTRWRAARDGSTSFDSSEQAELDALVDAEVRAAGERAAALMRK